MQTKNMLLVTVVLCLILTSFSTVISSQLKSDEIQDSSVFLSFNPNIVIPDDYNTIEKGINNANPGDIIFVRNGIYYENLVIDKEITIIGETKGNTVIDGILNLKSTITVDSPNVIIKNFSVINGLGGDASWDNSGVYINSSNVTVENNFIMYNTLGICALDVAHNLTICDNDFIENGVILANYEHTTDSFTLESVLHAIENNTVNSKPLYYIKDKNNFTVPNDAGQIILANCSNATIKDTFFTKAGFPILLYFCNNCLIENITSKDTYGEIIIFHSENCIIQNSNASDMIFGVCLDYQSTNNTVRYNHVYDNIAGITVMTSSRDNEVYENNIHDNTEGIRISNKSSNNHFYENKLSNNIFGFSLFLSPHHNNIENNTIAKSLLCVRSVGKAKNYFNGNYWNRPRVFPKIIFGCFQGKNTIPVIPIPCYILGIDRHPAREPTV